MSLSCPHTCLSLSSMKQTRKATVATAGPPWNFDPWNRETVAVWVRDTPSEMTCAIHAASPADEREPRSWVAKARPCLKSSVPRLTHAMSTVS